MKDFMSRCLDTEEKIQEFRTTWVKFLFSEAICDFLEKNKISREKLAFLLHKDISYVNTVLDEEREMNLEIFAKISDTLDAGIEIALVKRENQVTEPLLRNEEVDK